MLKRRDLLYYAEGGRSYSGELKTPKTGLLQAALQADRDDLSIVPMAVAYDLVLEDQILARQRSASAQRPFAQEMAEMARHAVGYQTRAFVTFGEPIPLDRLRPGLAPRSRDARRTAMHDAIGSALQGAAHGARRRRDASADDARGARARIDGSSPCSRTQAPTSRCTSGREAVDEGRDCSSNAASSSSSAAVAFRVRDRIVLRYYARTIQHLLVARRARTH